MPKQSQYTLDEAKARAAEVGDEWTPELEASLRKAGKIKDAPPLPLSRDTISALGPNLDINRESTRRPWQESVDMQAWQNRLPTAFSNQMFFDVGRNAADQPMPKAETKSGRFADAFGAGAAVGADFAMLAPAAGLAASAIPARIPAAVARGLMAARVPQQAASTVAGNLTRLPAIFAGQAALSGGNPARAALEGAAFSALPGVPIVRNLMANPVGAEAVNVAALTGMNMAEGMPVGEAFSTAIPTALGLKAGGALMGPSVDPLRERAAEMAKQAAETEAKARAFAEFEARAAAEKQAAEARAAAIEQADQAVSRADARLTRTPAEMEVPRTVSPEEAARLAELTQRELDRMDNPPELYGPRGERVRSQRQVGTSDRLDIAAPPGAVVPNVAEQYPRIIVPPRGVSGPQTPPPLNRGQALGPTGWPEATPSREAPRRNRPDLTLGMGLGGGGENFKFRELREEAGRAGGKLATWFSGTGTVEAAIPGASASHVVEYDPKIVGAYNAAHGTQFASRDVTTVTPQEVKESGADHFQASPECKRSSQANYRAAPNDKDIRDATAIARVIREAEMPSISIENVPRYKDTEAFGLIRDALNDAGYTWDVVQWNAADLGAAQNRTRMLIRAVRSGNLPPQPKKVAQGDWYEAVRDLIDSAPTSNVGPDELSRIEGMKDRGKIDGSKPIITMGESAFRGVASAANSGRPAPPLLSSPAAVPRIIMPDGRVVRVTPRMMARLMGLPDSFRVPDNIYLAKQVLGNGVEGHFTDALIRPLVESAAGRRGGGSPASGQGRQIGEQMEMPIAPPRGRGRDVALGMGLGGGGEAWKFKELREAAKNLGAKLAKGDENIAAGLMVAYTPGMKDYEFLAVPGVREKLMQADDPATVMAAIRGAAAGPQAPPTQGQPQQQNAPQAGAQAPRRAPASGGIAALRAAAQTPRANSRVDAAFREFLNGNEDIRGAATRLGSEPAAPTPAMLTAKRAEIRTRRKADMAATGITAKEWNEANLGGRNPKDAAEFEVVKSLANPDLVKALEADVAARAGGGKGPLNVANVSVNRAALHAQDYVYQGWGGGKVGRDNPFDAPLIRDKQTAREVTYAYNDRMSTEAIDILKRNGVKEDSPESSAIGKVIEYSGAAGMSPEQWIATPEGQAAMSGVKNPQGVLTAASELRDLLKRIRDDRNAVAEAYGEKPMAEREFFFPKYDQRIPWWKLFGEDSKLSKSMAGPETPDIIGMGLVAGEKGKKFDPHTKPRGADDSKRDWDAHRAMLRYIGDEASYIGGTPGIHNDYMNAKLLEMYGYGKAAEVVRNYGQSDFNRFKWGPMAGIENVFTQGGLLNVAGDVAKWNYDRLADAVFTLNLGWNLVVQPSSAVFVTGVAPPKDSAKGILGANSPEFRRFVDENVFARRVKSREGGSVSDVGRESSAVGMEAKGGDRITHWAQWQNRFIEKQIDYYAAYVGMKHGERLGLQGRELTDFMSDYIKKTQDVYNRQDRPEVVRSKMGQVIAPFSGFAFNMRSHLQENLGIPGASKVGTYTVNEGKAGRAGYAFRIAAGMALANVIARAVSGREDLYGPSALPLYDILTGGGASKGKIGPALVYDADKKTLKAMLDGKYGEGVARALRQRVKGSRQVSNFIMAMEFSSGNGPFLLPDDQIPQAVLTGVWSTPAGREYLDKMKGKKGGGDVAAPPAQTIRRPMLQRPPQIAPPRGQRLQQPTGGRK